MRTPLPTGVVLFGLLALLLSGCGRLLAPAALALPTPMPEEYLPTAVVLTSQAGAASSPAVASVESAASQPTNLPTPDAPTPTLETAKTAPAPVSPTSTPDALQNPATPDPSVRPVPFIPAGIPNNLIEIRNLGPLSKVASPLHVYGYLKTGAGSKARIELLGEDHRLLFGETKVFNVPEGGRAVLSMDISFEIAAPAEAGRLQVYVQDKRGRVTALNSVPLILLSLGEADINPPSDALDPLIIQQPSPKALIQGGKVLVSGMARVAEGDILMARLITETGGEVGLRLANVTLLPQGGYGAYAVEVPYTVEQPTPALLVVSQGDSDNSDFIHLSSVEVLLSP